MSLRQLSGSLAAALVIGALCFGAAELFLRGFAPIYLTGIQEAYRFDQETGVSLKPGIHMLKTTDHQQEMRSNALGTVNFQEDFDGYDSLIFAIGDSFTQGTGLAADASYPFQLDLALNLGEDGFYHKRVAVVNLGLAAYGAEQALLVLRRYRQTLGEPDAVVYLGYENDQADDLLFRSGRRHAHIVQDSPKWGHLVGPLLWLSDLEVIKRVKFAISDLRAEAVIQRRSQGDAPSASVAELQWPVIAQIVDEARQGGALVVVGWAEGDSPSYGWLKARAREEGLRFADWYPRSESVRRAIPALEMKNPHSGGHWRIWVNTIIARAVAAELAQISLPQEARAGPTSR